MPKNLPPRHLLYFESILQLRDVSPEMITYAQECIAKTGMRIAKTQRHDNGVDYYLPDKELTRTVGRKLKERYGGVFQLSPTLFGQKKGKEIYRLTVLYRAVNVNKGDKVLYQGDEYKVKIMGNDIMLQDVKTGKKVHLKYKDAGIIKNIKN